MFTDAEVTEVIIINESGDESLSFNKLAEFNGTIEQNIKPDIPINKINAVNQSFNSESADSDTQGKGRDTEEEDETPDVENNMDDGNLRRMVMEVIFGGQVTNSMETMQSTESKQQK